MTAKETKAFTDEILKQVIYLKNFRNDIDREGVRQMRDEIRFAVTIICKVLRQTNPKFDEAKFRKECGL